MEGILILIVLTSVIVALAIATVMLRHQRKLMKAHCDKLEEQRAMMYLAMATMPTRYVVKVDETYRYIFVAGEFANKTIPDKKVWRGWYNDSEDFDYVMLCACEVRDHLNERL